MTYQTITIGGQRVAYTTSAGTGPAILIIHGNSSSSRSFQHQLASGLGARYRMIALDLPDFGRSQPVPDAAVLGLQGWAGIVRDVVEALRLDPIVLVGWSLGGQSPSKP